MSAEPLSEAREKIDRLVELAKGKTSFLAQTHDYPDPDTIASALALKWLLEELTGLEGQLGYGGIIGRAENRAMIKVLGIKLKKTSSAEFKKYDLVALLDTQPECGNHSVPDGQMPDIVVDHHFERAPNGITVPFLDVGGDYGSTSTKVAELVRASGLTPPPEVATALFYGLKSDTANLTRISSKADLDTYLWLFPLIDTKAVAEIEQPQVPLEYFRVLNKAIERGKVHNNFIVADLGAVYTPDLCAEVADRLLQVEDIRHAIATGYFEDSLFISLRTRSRMRNAGKVLHKIVTEKKWGSAGGHGPMAGARIDVSGKSHRARTEMRRRVLQEVLTAFGQDPRHFQRIVRKDKPAKDKTPRPPKPRESTGSNGAAKSEPPEE